MWLSQIKYPYQCLLHKYFIVKIKKVYKHFLSKDLLVNTSSNSALSHVSLTINIEADELKINPETKVLRDK